MDRPDIPDARPKDSSMNRIGTALVISGPSGAGKSTVCAQVLTAWPDLRFSVSCTTRTPRPGEVNGKDYHFLARAEYDRLITAGEFLEHAEVHGNGYGTLRREVEPFLERGGDVLLDIDVQGARQVRQRIAGTPLAGHTVFTFLAPPSLAVLEQRLRGRGTDAEEVIRRRLENARCELAAWREYEYLVINDQVTDAAADLLAILRAGHCRSTSAMWDPLA